MLGGTVEMDETYIGGKRRMIAGKKPAHDKEVVIGIRQRGVRYPIREHNSAGKA